VDTSHLGQTHGAVTLWAWIDRLAMLLAVPASAWWLCRPIDQDVFVKVVGGVKVTGNGSGSGALGSDSCRLRQPAIADGP